MKSEPDVFSIDDLKQKKRELWDGVRNYQARNFMRDQMASGDLILFYHSNATPPGVAGVAQVVGPAQPDRTALNPASEYFDPTATPENPRWWLVEVEYVATFKRLISLNELRDQEALQDMVLLKPGNRLSVMPVRAEEFQQIVALGGLKNNFKTHGT